MLGVSAWACTVVPLAEPAPGTTLDGAQPTLMWAGDAPVRLQVAWVVPESGIWRVDDLRVEGGRWRSPEPLASAFLAVKVRISHGCPDDSAIADLLALGPAFFVDRRSTCTLDPRSFRRDGAWLRWRGLPQASSYRVRQWGVDGWRLGWPLRPKDEGDTAEPAWPWTAAVASSGQPVTVQAVCGDVIGPPVPWAFR